MIRIEGSGGGRWYDLNWQVSWWAQGPDYRHLLVEGTHEPLSFYQLSPEHATSDAQMEFRHARNIDIYGLSFEGVGSATLWMRDCRNVRIYGYWANGTPLPHRSAFRIDDSNDFLLSNVSFQQPPLNLWAGSYAGWSGFLLPFDPRKWFLISDTTAQHEPRVRLRGTEQFVVYERGEVH